MHSNVKDLYDSTSHNYDKRHENPTAKYARKKEFSMVKKYSSGRILDIGCGTGEHLKLVGGFGTDISYNMIMEARKKSSLQFVQSNAEGLPFSRESFDTVLCMFSVLNLCDFDKAICEMKRVLKTGGTSVVSVSSLLDRFDNPTFSAKSKSMRI